MSINSGKSARVLRAILGVVGLLAVAAMGLYLWKSGILSIRSSIGELRALIDRAGPLAWLTFFILQMMTVIIAPIPSNVMMVAGALALGFTRALILGVLAILCASIIVFLLARRLGRGAVLRLIDRGVLEKYLPLIEEKQDMFLFLTLLFPFFPDDMLCILAGLTSIPTARFIVIMVFTRPWGLAVAALLGSGGICLPPWVLAVSLAVMAVLFVVAMKYARQIEDALLRAINRIIAKPKK